MRGATPRSVPLDVVSDQLEHSTIAFTAERNGDVHPERFAAVADAMPKHYGPTAEA